MAGYSKFIWGAGLAVGLALVSQFSALADEKKKAEGDNFSQKLKDRFPSEAKRGGGIFCSVKDLDTGDSKKEAPKEDAPDKKKADEKKPEPRVVKEASKDEEKPKFMLADLFKSKSNKVDEKALKDATANGESEEVKDKKEEIKPMLVSKPSDSEAKLDEIKDEEKSARRVSAPKFFGKKTTKVEAPVVAETTPAKPEEVDKKEGADTDDPKAKEKKKEKSKGWASNSKLFGKKSTKAETLVIPEDGLTNKPAPKVEFSKVDTSKDLGEGGDFKSWDDLPYKRKSSVDRMMGKLNIKRISPRPAAGLPGPRLPGGPSKPAPKSE